MFAMAVGAKEDVVGIGKKKKKTTTAAEGGIRQACFCERVLGRRP